MVTTYNNSANYQPTQYDVLVGASNNGISSVGPGTAGQILQSGGASANPAYSTATYPATAGATGNILRSDGTNWVSTQPAEVYITTITASNSASIAFTSTYITSTYSTYKIILNNIVPITDATTFQCFMSTDNGSTYLATNYASESQRNLYTSASLSTISQTTYISIGTSTSNTAVLGISGNINFYGLPATIIKCYQGVLTSIITGGTTFVLFEVYGSQSGTATVNNLKFQFLSGNISTGSISLYGII